jgi:hypothetical protein
VTPVTASKQLLRLLRTIRLVGVSVVPSAKFGRPPITAERLNNGH